MKFDPDTYDATDLFRIESENFYKCPIKNDDKTKQGIIEARRDWTEDAIVRLEEADLFWIRALHNNQQFKEMALEVVDAVTVNKVISLNIPPPIFLDVPRYKGTLVNAVYRKSDDAFIGWDMCKTIHQTHITLFSAVLPEHRNQGHHTEMEIAGSKYIFGVRNYLESIARIPISESNSNWAISMSESFEAGKNESIDRGFPVRYGEAKITIDSYHWWINQPENKKFKDSYFDYSDLYS